MEKFPTLSKAPPPIGAHEMEGLPGASLTELLKTVVALECQLSQSHKFGGDVWTRMKLFYRNVKTTNQHQHDLSPDKIASLSAPCPSHKNLNVKTLTFCYRRRRHRQRGGRRHQTYAIGFPIQPYRRAKNQPKSFLWRILNYCKTNNICGIKFSLFYLFIFIFFYLFIYLFFFLKITYWCILIFAIMICHGSIQ